jgi:DNA-binding GntR family transcriptional regulator
MGVSDQTLPTELFMDVDRSGPIPLYYQVATRIEEAIRSGKVPAGSRLENEVALSERLGLSRPTVRRAIQDVVDKGLLVRRRGLGTTVASRKVHRKFELSSLYDDLARAGREPRTTVLEVELTTDDKAAAGLDLPRDTQLLRVVRVRYAGDLPLAVLRNWLPPRHSDLTREELVENGLYAALRERGVKPVVAQQNIGARMPTAAERRHLDIRGAHPVLAMTRMAFDSSGEPVEYGDHAYRASDYTIDLMVDER